MDTTRFEVEEASSLRGKLVALKSRGLSKVHDIQRGVRDRGTSQVMKVNDSMKTRPMLWAGIAAASGFGIGLIGRFAHWRNKHRRMTPDLVIIESSC